MPSKDLNSRAAYSPSEFAALFGKSATWGYRQLYSGKVKAISGQGRLAIPASEVERLTGTAGIYEGKPTVKKKLSVLKPKVRVNKTWPELLKDRRGNAKLPIMGKTRPVASTEARAAAFKRMSKSVKKSTPLLPD